MYSLEIPFSGSIFVLIFASTRFMFSILYSHAFMSLFGKHRPKPRKEKRKKIKKELRNKQ